MSTYTIYHNPRCSKSRQTLELLNQQGVSLKVVEYLKNPPSANQLKTILKALGLKPKDIIRKSEAEYKASGLDNNQLTQAQQIKLMVENPKVIERPIVVCGNKAVIGRPPENVNQLF